MGTSRSTLIRPGEIPAYVQRDDWCKSAGVGIFTEPARFKEHKPYELNGLSDDNWAALTLRVDPLARFILDPHRSYVGAAFLCLVATAVFSAVRPRLNNRTMGLYNDDTYLDLDDGNVGDDYYSYLGDDFFNGVDDVVLSEKRYREEEINHEMLFWAIGFVSVLVMLLVSIAGLAIAMERRNAKFDDKIRAVCSEMRPRFEAEGFSIEYRTKIETGVISGYMRPVRVIIFRRIDGDSSQRYRAPPSVENENDMRCSSNLSTVSASNAHYSTLMVQVPEESLPGEALQVTTPSGRTIMVSVPLGVRAGQQFPVLIPARFQQQLVSPPSQLSNYS